MHAKTRRGKGGARGKFAARMRYSHAGFHFAQAMFSEVTNSGGITAVAELAAEIWREHYRPIIGDAQVEYMLEKFQSADAIREQIAREGFHYYLIRAEKECAGYFGFQCGGGALFLSKLYVKKSARGTGLGARAVQFLRAYARANGMQKIRLSVNKNNHTAINAYHRTGFTRTGEIVTDIGGGFVMDDYLFELGV